MDGLPDDIGPIEYRFRCFAEGRISTEQFLDLSVRIMADSLGDPYILRADWSSSWPDGQPRVWISPGALASYMRAHSLD